MRGRARKQRAQRALARQLEYQRSKAAKLRGRELETIEWMRQRSAHARRELESLRPLPSGARILEVGSGAHGLIFFFGAGLGIGVDPLAAEYAGLFPAWQHLACTVAAAGEHLPFPNSSFDVVLCDNVVDHAEDPRHIVEEVVRLLRPDALLYFTVNVHHPLYAVASHVHGAWTALGIRYEIGPFADHTVHLTPASARSLFAGLPVRRLRERVDMDAARASAGHRPRHIGDHLKRVFFKNARYELIAARSTA